LFTFCYGSSPTVLVVLIVSHLMQTADRSWVS